eukprot:UN06451
MSFSCDKETKGEMRVEMDAAVDKFMFKKFRYATYAYKNAHQCMATCYDKNTKAQPIWNCLKDCRRTLDNSQRYLHSIVTEFLTEPASECLADSIGTTQASANELYTKCIRTHVSTFQKIRNECMA